jgi:hypothetical protein
MFELEEPRETIVCLKIGSTRAFSIWIETSLHLKSLTASGKVNPSSEIKQID